MLAKSSAGTLRITGPQSHGAGALFQVGQGKVVMTTNAGIPATAGSAAQANLSINIFNGGGDSGMAIGSHQDLKEASVHFADAGVQGLDLNSPAAAGAYNALRIYASDLDGTKLAMSDAIANAKSNPGDGVYDSGLSYHPSSAIGVAVLNDVHGDQMVMVRTTRIGDLNLDGAVTISDFIDLASNFNTSNPGLTWQEGDLNGDHAVTISDFIDLAANFNSSYSGGKSEVRSQNSEWQMVASFASSIGVDPSVIGSAVPEPGTLGVLAIGAMGLTLRRRRQLSHE